MSKDKKLDKKHPAHLVPGDAYFYKLGEGVFARYIVLRQKRSDEFIEYAVLKSMKRGEWEESTDTFHENNRSIPYFHIEQLHKLCDNPEDMWQKWQYITVAAMSDMRGRT